MRAEEDYISYEALQTMCEQIEEACASADYDLIKMLLEKNVSGYKMHASETDPVMHGYGFVKPTTLPHLVEKTDVDGRTPTKSTASLQDLLPRHAGRC